MAAQAANMELIEFAFKLTLPISLVAIAAMAVTHFFWQRYLDQKAGEHNAAVAPSDRHRRPRLLRHPPLHPHHRCAAV